MKEREQLAQWFENCGMDKLDVKTIARIIRKWVPEETKLYTGKKKIECK